MAGHPAGDALADLEAELLHVLAFVLADLAAPRDRYAVVAMNAIDAHVVEVDERVQLRADRLADVLTVRNRVRRAPSCWIDWRCAAQVAIWM